MAVVPIVVMNTGEISSHDAAVLNKVNTFIDTAYGTGLTVTETLEPAQAMAEGARQGPHDLVGRDVEYYLKCRHEVSKQEHLVTAVPVAIGAGFEEVMRTDKDVPVTSPGGIWWGHKGCMDGSSDNGKVTEIPKHERIETAPTYPVPINSFGDQIA